MGTHMDAFWGMNNHYSNYFDSFNHRRNPTSRSPFTQLKATTKDKAKRRSASKNRVYNLRNK